MNDKENKRNVPEVITVITGKLRKLDKGWAQKLAEKINQSGELEEGEEIDQTKVYNIANGNVTFEAWRNLYILYGDKLISELEETAGKIIDQVQKISEKHTKKSA